MATATLNLAAPAIPRLVTADEFWDFCQLPENQWQSYELIRGMAVPNSPAKR